MSGLGFWFERTLVLAPHADDETFGCGGLLARLKREGSGKAWVLLGATGGGAFLHLGGAVPPFEERIGEARRAAEVLGFELLPPLCRPEDEDRMDRVPQVELITGIENALMEVRPTAVLVPGPSHHQDHRALFLAAYAALRPSVYLPRPRLVALYEYPYTPWLFEPPLTGGDLYVDISEDLETKIAALRCYKSQSRVPDSPLSEQSVRAMSRMRGMAAGFREAELYRVVRGSI